MGLKLQVRILEARDLTPKSTSGFVDAYVRLQLNAHTGRSSTVIGSLNPKWNEEFVLGVEDPETDTLTVTVYDQDFQQSHDFLGKMSVQVADLTRVTAESGDLGPTWFPLQKKSPTSRIPVRGNPQILSDTLRGFTHVTL